MQETYPCPDGRVVVLRFDEDSLKAEAITGEGLTIGRFQFALVAADGEAIDPMQDIGEAVSFKLAESDLDDAWHGQGITERVMNLVAEELIASPKGPS